MATTTNPQALAVVVAFGNQPLAVSLHATDAAAGTRYNQSDILASHLSAVVEQECLHQCCHLTPPKGCDNDDVLIVTQRDANGIDGRIKKKMNLFIVVFLVYLSDSTLRMQLRALSVRG